MILKIYTMENCPYCKQLKDLFDGEKLKYEEIDINDEDTKAESDEVFKVTNADSVPIVRVGFQLLAPDIGFTSIEEAFELTKEFLKA